MEKWKKRNFAVINFLSSRGKKPTCIWFTSVWRKKRRMGRDELTFICVSKKKRKSKYTLPHLTIDHTFGGKLSIHFSYQNFTFIYQKDGKGEKIISFHFSFLPPFTSSNYQTKYYFQLHVKFSFSMENVFFLNLDRCFAWIFFN